MEGRKVVPPWPSMITFYYYYSYIIMILCWMLTPIVFYIVFTQSKVLKNFKWLILNHLFWCLALETVLALVKPLFLLPVPGGIHVGVFRDVGDFHFTACAAILTFAFAGNCVIGLTATIGSRYMLAFPSPLTEWFSFKITIWCMVIFSLIIYVMLCLAFFPLAQMDVPQIRQWALEYDPFLENYFDEPSFFVVPHWMVDTPSVAVLCLIGFLILISGVFLIFFMYLALKFRSVTAAKLKYSLIMSSIVQVFMTGFLLVIPITFFFVFVAFDIRKSATSTCACLCVIMSHCLVEYFATLYYILPYRKYIKKVIDEKILRKTKNVMIIQISQTNVMSFNPIIK